MNTALLNQTDLFLISVPRIDTKRFKALVKAFGWCAEKQDTLNASTLAAIKEIEEGQYTEYASVDDYLKALG